VTNEDADVRYFKVLWVCVFVPIPMIVCLFWAHFAVVHNVIKFPEFLP